MQNANHFAAIWALGYPRLCPIVPPHAELSERSSLYKRLHAKNPRDDRGKVPGVRGRDGAWFGFDFVQHESTEEDLQRWHAMGAGVGIKTGAGLALIDADAPNEEHAKIIRDTLEQHLGFLPPVRVGNYPKAGYLVRTDTDFQYSRIDFGERDEKGRLRDRVEILSEGRQFVAHGTHPKTGKPYRWPDGIPAYKDVPFVEGAKLTAFLDALRPLLPAASEVIQEGAASDVDPMKLTGDPELIRQAVAATPNTSDAFPTRDAWRDYLYAIKGAFGPGREAEALEVAQDWSARWTDGDNDPEYVEAEFGRMKPTRVGASMIYELAEQHSGGQFTKAAQFFEQPHESIFGGDQAPASQGDLPKTFKYRFLSLAEAADRWNTASKPPLIKGLLDQGAMSILYGESNTGKTFVALDQAFHVATGRPWGDRKTAHAPVLYVVAEGGDGILKRAQALRVKYGSEAADSALLRFLVHPVNLLRADADLKPLIEAIRGFDRAPAFIVIDTLSRAMAGGDENASTDMGAMVKHLDLLRAATGAHLMAIHHSGKDRARGARGHSLLRAATDTEIEIGDNLLTVTKQRDLDGSFSTGFALEGVTLGVDADGEPVTSCTVRLLHSDEVRVGDATPKEQDVLQALDDCESTSTSRGEGVSVADLVRFFGQSGDIMSNNSIRHLLRSLTAKRLVEQVSRGKWAKKVAENPSATLVERHFVQGEVAESGGEVAASVFE